MDLYKHGVGLNRDSNDCLLDIVREEKKKALGRSTRFFFGGSALIPVRPRHAGSLTRGGRPPGTDTLAAIGREPSTTGVRSLYSNTNSYASGLLNPSPHSCNARNTARLPGRQEATRCSCSPGTFSSKELSGSFTDSCSMRVCHYLQPLLTYNTGATLARG